jgi:hypothetical protein
MVIAFQQLLTAPVTPQSRHDLPTLLTLRNLNPKVVLIVITTLLNDDL